MTVEPDTTGRRALEERVTHLEKMESIGRLAGGIAHDFNNLLTAILGYTELLLSDRPVEDPDRAALEEIQKAGQRAAALTRQLLAFSRKQVLLPQEVDLNQTVLGLQSMLNRVIREDITLTCAAATEPAVVRVDPAQIEQAILNLVLNARDALPAGGSIRVDVSRLRAADVKVPVVAAAADAYVRLRVSDNGAGIDPDARPHLFEPFFTTKEHGKGTGLGLSSVQEIVQRSLGWIDVTSAAGEGAAFSMHFPAVVLRDARELPASPPVQPAGGRETILLVEDEEAVRRIICAVLRRQGYTVLDTGSPLTAIEIFDQRAAEIDLLLTDVVMPVMNGPALAQRLVASRPELRVLFVSGYTGMAVPDIRNANVAFLHKPFQSSVLAARVREILDRSTPPRPPAPSAPSAT
jgi:two-component system cell cycle sensor histidine kinase/response regulator CckA